MFIITLVCHVATRGKAAGSMIVGLGKHFAVSPNLIAHIRR
ncbi:hypothetical protein GPLA_2414 [Paraglaciecola polaris LMG 21857]|uniref:Uncharacterized protein n=1 Tax=Paraglaciecola polaris LMG 21857 TaxID=1129793 RepID=K6YKV4_9ALTE|nr:hypothetical protein GPLA_2414 [Paraglaciecola polaris LMG 21857]